jgi:hypothetical protein
VTIDTLMETPILQFEPIVEASGAELHQLGSGLAQAELDGQPAVRWEAEDAAVTIKQQLNRGKWKVRVRCAAPDGGTDSFWVVLDGEQQSTPFQVPRGQPAWSEFLVPIREPGEHEVKLILRESPGMLMTDLQFGRTKVIPGEPPVREEMASQRPRLYLTPAMVQRLPELAEAAKATYKPTGSPSEKLNDYDAASGSTGWARNLPRYALSYLIQPDPEYLKPLKAQVMNIVEFPHWGNPKWGRMIDVDLDGEYAMEGVALCYDWLYDEWTDEERATIRDKIALQCERIFDASLAGRTGGGHSYQQNHYWFAHYALVLGAAAVYGEVPEAEEWLAWGYDRMERILVTFADDGGFHEHPAYWDFSMPPLFQYIDLYEYLTGKHIPAGDQWLSKTAYYRFHNVFPGWKRSAALGDSSKTMGPGLLTNYMWLAKRYNDPVVWGMVDLLTGGPNSSVWCLLYADPDAPRKDPLAELPVAHEFTDIETAFARTDWTPDATMVAFISRPMGGRFWWEVGNRYGLGGTGHNHPDANHFILFGRGEVLCVDPGYTYAKKTANHNTVLVDGQGQYGDGEMWPALNEGWAEIEEFRHQNGVTYMRGNATRQYKPELGLKRFVRQLELRDRDHVVVVDELSAEQARTFTWLLHHEGELVQVEPDVFEMTKGDAKLGIQVFCGEKHEARLGSIEPNYEHPRRSVRPTEAPVMGELAGDVGPTAQALIVVALTIGDAGEDLPRARRVGDGEGWVAW